MSFWRPNIYWTDQLRWYERVCVATWWLGQLAFAASIVAGAGMAITAVEAPLPGMTNAGVLQSAAVTLLAGIAALTGARLMLVLAIRTSADRGGW